MRMVKTVMAAAVLLGFVGGAHGQTISIGLRPRLDGLSRFLACRCLSGTGGL